MTLTSTVPSSHLRSSFEAFFNRCRVTAQARSICSTTVPSRAFAALTRRAGPDDATSASGTLVDTTRRSPPPGVAGSARGSERAATAGTVAARLTGASRRSDLLSVTSIAAASLDTRP